MKVWWYRVASITSMLFVAGHTYGFLHFRPPSADGLRVWSEMNSVHFNVGSQSVSYGGFYVGFGLIISASMAFLAILMWWMGERSNDEIRGLRTMTWLLAVLETVILGFSLRYFGVGPAGLSAISAVSLGRAALLKEGGART
jgi:hypothetical protein